MCLVPAGTAEEKGMGLGCVGTMPYWDGVSSGNLPLPAPQMQPSVSCEQSLLQSFAKMQSKRIRLFISQPKPVGSNSVLFSTYS